jgi:hypothetical protein
MKLIDYGWIPMLGIVILLVVFWKPMAAKFSDITGGTQKKAVIAKGKEVFYDTERWGEYKSCAMCHAADFKPDPGKKIDMADYKPGQPVSLAGAAKRNGGVLTGEDQLLAQINECIALPDRMGKGKISPNAPFMKDLVVYVKSL